MSYKMRPPDAGQPHQNSDALWVPSGTTLLQSPGCNEGKARNETLGIYERKVISNSVGAALTARVLGHLLLGCAAPLGLNRCVSMLNPGLAPWAMQEYRPYRARFGECVVLVSVSTRTYLSVYVYLLKWVHVLILVSARTQICKYVVLSGDYTCSLYKLQP